MNAETLLGKDSAPSAGKVEPFTSSFERTHRGPKHRVAVDDLGSGVRRFRCLDCGATHYKAGAEVSST